MVLTRIAELAAQIQENTAKVDNYLQSKDLPSPSFDEDGPVDFGIESEEIAKARERAREASLELHDLLLGPALCLRPILNGVSLQTIYKYNIAHHVPLHGEISFKKLSVACGLDEVNLRRALRFAMAFHHVFQEPWKGVVRHSAASRRLVESSVAQDALGYMFDEVWQSLAHTVEAHEKFKSDKPNESGWSLSQQTDKSVWEHYESHPALAKRFSGAMSAFFNGIGNSPSFLLTNYPWASLSGTSKKAFVVDVGGSRGDISIMLAQSFPNLSFVVQDLPQTIQGADSNVPLELRERVKFMAHDAFKEQPVEADAYLFRIVFHDWSDAHVIRMLEATVPALKPGARIIVNDHLIPEPNTLSWSKERQIRSMDILMWSLFNSRERDEADWRMLFAQADERFKDIRIWVPEGATMAIIEAIWEG